MAAVLYWKKRVWIIYKFRTPSKSSNFPKNKNKEPSSKKPVEEKVETQEEGNKIIQNEKTSNTTNEVTSINPNLPRNKLAQRNNPSKSSSSKKKPAPINTKKEARKWNDIDDKITNQDIDKFDQ